MALHLRSLMVGLILGVVVLGSVFAFADDGGDRPTIRTASTTEPSEETSGTPEWAEPGTLTGRDALGGQGSDPSEETDFWIEDRPSAALVEACRGDHPPTTDLHCDAIEAVANGELEPGFYSDDELRRRLSE